MKFVFINPPGDKDAVSQRDRELQGAEARAHAARVSRHRLRAGIVKRGTGGRSTSRPSTSFGIPNALALRPAQGSLSRSAKIRDHIEKDHISLDKRRFQSPSTSSLGQAQVGPFDSVPVKGLDNVIYVILDFGIYHILWLRRILMTSLRSIRFCLSIICPRCSCQRFTPSPRKLA